MAAPVPAPAPAPMAATAPMAAPAPGFHEAEFHTKDIACHRFERCATPFRRLLLDKPLAGEAHSSASGHRCLNTQARLQR